jgi:predicted metalloprotease with PDZ domain
MASHGTAGRGVALSDIVEAASIEAGEDMAWFFEQHVEGTKPIALPALLRRLGVKVEARVPWQSSGPSKPADPSKRAWIGVSLRDHTVTSIVPKGPAERVGLMRGDEIVAVDARRTDKTVEVARALGRAGVGESSRLHVFRDGRLLELEVGVEENPEREYSFELTPAARLDKKTLRLREAWLAHPGEDSRQPF